MRLGTVVILLVAFGCAGSPGFAGWAALAPKPTENGAFFDLFGSVEHDDNRSGTWPFRWTDTFLREKVTLFSDGYFYHPRFLQYHVSIGGAIRQEQYRATGLDTDGWTHSSGVEYQARFFLLPEKPYNLELFALRYEPLYKEQAATRHNSLQTSWGGLFRYRRQPWFAHASFTDNTNQSGASSSDVTRAGLGGEYFMQYRNGNKLSFSSAFNPSRFSNSVGLEGNSSEYLFGNYLDLRRVRLSSSLTSSTSDETNAASGTYETDQFAWYEVLNIYLPLNFRSDLIYRYHDNESTIPNGNILSDLVLTDISREFLFDVVHRLFHSLDTTYTYMDNSRSSSSGDTTFRSNALGLNYTKLIPRGRVLAGVNLTRGETDSQGQTDVVNEPHLGSPVPGSFTLDQLNILPQSVVMLLKSPLAPFQTIRLVENVHYTVTAIASTLQITVVALPPLFVVPGTFDFYVSYTLAGGDFGLRTNTVGTSTSVELFDQTLTPYFNYGAVRTDVVSGVFPGVPLDSTTRMAGVLVRRGPLRARGEYQTVDWDVSPYRSFRVELQYVDSPNPTTRVYATASYLNKYYWDGTSIQLGEPYTDATASAAGSVQKQIFSRNLSLSAGGSLSRLRGPVDTTGYALNASLIWKVGKLELTTGASAYTSSSEGLTTVSNDRTHEYYYVSIRRRLF